MIVVTGATGQLGRLVIEQLLARVPAEQIVAAVRSPEKATDLSAKGVQVRHADYSQPATLDSAFAGADKVLLISSSEIGQRFSQHKAVIDAAKRAGVRLLAYTSVQHAEASTLGLAKEHVETEAYLRASVLPFALLLFAYFMGSATRLAENPTDKLLPSAVQMADAVNRMAFTADTRTGDYLLWQDSASSLKRLAIGLGISALLGLCLGIAAGILPLFGAPLSPLLTVLSMVPPLAILPILFIVFGLGELSKVMLIVIGITPILARDLEQRAREIPIELLIKAQTLGASTWTLILRVVLPQLLPRLLIALRLVLGSAWLFLIAAEAIASTDGLGYRIFLVRRYLAMDVILPYVVWITLLAWLMDWGLKALTRRAFPWYEGARA
ncbi:aldehyde dehydrogenase family protein [Pseudomonas syringae pv. spinaceae]|uniref:Aldehyde dehydrogenase family protein n=1 Tax=Pseudomonas syringae pv. spinaceae TaxID=264459 RepID=A0A0Q0AMV5_PSESX|nr:NAD(P)H-binding protein [Pseudomonas syringae]KPY64452.1 aldehyde dehydrogenase family protein [Pseudomonas syringae pv. spinaceae]